MAKQAARGISEIDSSETRIRTVPSLSVDLSHNEERIPESGPLYAQKEDLKWCDGLLMGSPTRFGNMAAPLKFFIDSTADIWVSGALSGKPCGLFTSTASMHGGQESTLLSMMLPALHHGMIIVGIPYTEAELSTTQSGGTPYGASHVAGQNADMNLSQEEKNLLKALGKRVALTAQKLKGP